VTIDEQLIRDVLLKSSPRDLDRILTTVEAYRSLVTAGRRLERTRGMGHRREQVLHCAEYCRKVLQEYTETGQIAVSATGRSGEVRFTFVLAG
jgi:hypothetical protein